MRNYVGFTFSVGDTTSMFTINIEQDIKDCILFHQSKVILSSKISNQPIGLLIVTFEPISAIMSY
jgi:hypothetical protein